jgi:spore germination protein GerM
LLAALSPLLASCGVGTQDVAQPIGRENIPPGLLSPTSTTTTAPVSGAVVSLYFVGPHGGLVPVARRIKGTATVQAALDQLDQGPTPAESAAGLQSPVSAVSPVVVKGIDGGVVALSVPSAFTTLGGQDQILAASQIVYTATAATGISAVTVLVNGQPAQVPTTGGTLSNGPLTRADYPQ